MAMHDHLTDLPNRLVFQEELTKHILQENEAGGSIAVLCLDLDYFKSVNDTLGHVAGDTLLREVTSRLKREVGNSGVLARVGGDEFAILQVRALQPAGASNLAQAIVESLSKPFDLAGQQINIGVSVGISLYPQDGNSPESLLKNSDLALYKAKAEGRRRYRFFEPAMDATMQAKRRMEADLRRAIQNAEFELHYQPLMSLLTYTISGFEALIRWNHPSLGLISPAEFIPIAEETGLICEIGDWVLQKACDEAAGWPDEIKIAVNLSPLQFKRTDIVGTIRTCLAKSGLSPSRLELEITELVLLQDDDENIQTLHALRKIGARISLDDFGTGYSSLSYLRAFPFDKIKIDQSFVRELTLNKECAAIVHAVSQLGRALGMGTTAEGVETVDQLDKLRAEGCTEVQGYLFSKPRPAAEISGMIAAMGCGPDNLLRAG